MADEDTRRVSWTLPSSMVDRVIAHQEDRGFNTQSEAAADLFSNAGNPDTGVAGRSTIDGPFGEAVVSEEPGITSLGDGVAPARVDPHESYPTIPNVPPGETVETIGTDGAPIAPDTHGVIGDSEQTADDATNDAPDVELRPSSDAGDAADDDESDDDDSEDDNL